MSSYQVRLTAEAVRTLGRIPEKARIAILETIRGSIAENPRRAGKALAGQLSGLWSARRGDFRVIYTIDDHAREVVVIRAQHRSDAYRSR